MSPSIQPATVSKENNNLPSHIGVYFPKSIHFTKLKEENPEQYVCCISQIILYLKFSLNIMSFGNGIQMQIKLLGSRMIAY